MISIRIGQSGLDALRAYDPTTQFYSGEAGVKKLLSHCVVELVYERDYEPHSAYFLTNRRYDRVRLPNGRFVTKTTGMWTSKPVYRDMSERSRVPVDPLWRGAPKRRMLVTRDFTMLNSWGLPVFGFVPPKPHVKKPQNNVLVVWDCLWHDWRRIDLNEPISVSAVIPTTMFPGVDGGGVVDREARRLLDMQKQILFKLYEANFHNHGKQLLNYMDNTMNLSLQFQEENIRKRLFDEHEQHLKELEERRRKDAERRERQRLEKERLEKERQERERQMQEQQQQAALQKQQEQQRKQQMQQQAQQPAATIEEQEAKNTATDKTNLEKKGPVEIKDGSATRANPESQRTGQPEQSAPSTNREQEDPNAIPENGIIGQNNERKEKKPNGR